jgi:hypothetical protein
MTTVLVPRKEARATTLDVPARSAVSPARFDWHACTPPQIAEADDWHDGTAGWAAWVDHLATRTWPVPAPCWAGRRSPLTWALPSDLADSDSAGLIARLRKPFRAADGELIAGELRAWLVESSDAPAEPGLALQCLAWCHALPRLARHVSASSWWELLERLRGISSAGQDAGRHQRPWPQQLLAAEMPLTLAWMLPELESCRRLATAGSRQLDSSLVELLDDKGLLLAIHGEALGPLLACWTRCLTLASTPDGCWSEETHERYAHAVRSALRLTRGDGNQALGDQVADLRGVADMLETAIHLAGDDELSAIAAASQTVAPARRKPTKATKLGKKAGRRAPRRDRGRRLPSPAVASERAQLAILRSQWRRGSPLLVVKHGSAVPLLELASGNEVLLSGPMQAEIRARGETLPVAGRWESICWESDEAMDYLELELELASGARVQRQFLLAREARLLLIADAITRERTEVHVAEIDQHAIDTSPQAVLGAAGALDSWEYRLRLSLPNGVSFEGREETREGCLCGQRRSALAIPLALREWKTDGHGTLGNADGQLEYRVRGAGAGMYAPLLFDLNPRRFSRVLTWRRLTVGENRRILPAHEAAGFRVQIGREQWVLYRSLTGAANRTLLGLNFYHEFLLGRFERDGACKPILEIEPA